MTQPREKPGFGKGVLRRTKGLQKFGGGRFHPPDSLAPFVEHFWTTHWDLRGEPVYEQDVLPHPTVNVVLEPGCSEVVGVMTGKFTRRLEGLGRVFSATFWPGGYSAFHPGPLTELTDRRVPLGDLLDVDVPTLERRVFVDAGDDAERVDALVGALEACRPRLDPAAAQARDIVRTIIDEPEILRVDDIAAQVGLGVRTLQRLFARHVGVSPKWVIQRKRLHDAAERLAAPEPPDLAALAAELGYADQAHFVRDFRSVVGVAPGSYTREL
ncbi:MAG: helix-turn-helix domain-containing protein [Nannocystales bacterium]